MTEVELSSEIAVEEIRYYGHDAVHGTVGAAAVMAGEVDDSVLPYDDAVLAAAARVSTKGWAALPEKEQRGLLNFLMANRHGTPFEHGSLTVRAHGPACMWWEWVRHRIAWSYNLESSRYKQMSPLFYVPPRDRPMIRPDGFKSARPAFDRATDEEYAEVVRALKEGYRHNYELYEHLLEIGVDRGLARDVLGFGVYFAGYCTANPRSIMAFLELRTNEPTAKRPSKPLFEIDVAARKLEGLFAARWPMTHSLWVANGRMAP